MPNCNECEINVTSRRNHSPKESSISLTTRVWKPVILEPNVHRYLATFRSYNSWVLSSATESLPLAAETQRISLILLSQLDTSVPCALRKLLRLLSVASCFSWSFENSQSSSHTFLREAANVNTAPEAMPTYPQSSAASKPIAKTF